MGDVTGEEKARARLLDALRSRSLAGSIAEQALDLWLSPECRPVLLEAARAVDRDDAQIVGSARERRVLIETAEKLVDRVERAEAALVALREERDEAVRLLAEAIRDGWQSFAADDFLARASRTGGECK